jgi:hypothetical protein
MVRFLMPKIQVDKSFSGFLVPQNSHFSSLPELSWGKLKKWIFFDFLGEKKKVV